MATMTAGLVRDGARWGFKSRLTNPFLALAMALGYLVGTLGMAGLAMTASWQRRKPGRGAGACAADETASEAAAFAAVPTSTASRFSECRFMANTAMAATTASG